MAGFDPCGEAGAWQAAELQAGVEEIPYDGSTGDTKKQPIRLFGRSESVVSFIGTYGG
ncbi:hypothetical protein J31TS3_56590 [Paenibacillus lactis]|nr:hypothetical protein J31TS3_56590 [Paenibacillus lactis]